MDRGHGQVTPNELNIAPLMVWIIAASQLLTFGLTLWNILSSGSKSNGRAISEHGARLDGHELRLQSVEQAQRSTPAREDLHKLQLAMADLQGEIKVMSTKLAGSSQIMERLEDVVSRHEQHLLEGARK